MLSMGGRLWKMMQKMVGLFWENPGKFTPVSPLHTGGAKPEGLKISHTHTHTEWNTDTHSHWLLHTLHKLTGVPSWLITFNIFIIYTPPAALQQYIIHLHSAPSALCHKKLRGRSHRGRHAHMSINVEEHYPHVHKNNLSVTAFGLLLPIPPFLPTLTPSMPHYYAGELELKRKRDALTLSC